MTPKEALSILDQATEPDVWYSKQLKRVHFAQIQHAVVLLHLFVDEHEQKPKKAEPPAKEDTAPHEKVSDGLSPQQPRRKNG